MKMFSEHVPCGLAGWNFKKKAREEGFTLIELLVAIAVAGSVFVVLLNAFGANLRSTGIAEGYTTAAFLAKDMIAQLENKEGISIGKEEGDFGEDYSLYRWKTEIEKDNTLPFYIVKAAVIFERRGIEREVQINTILIEKSKK